MFPHSSTTERFCALYDRYYRTVVALLVRLGLTRDDARDLAQDVFVRVYEHMDKYRGSSEWTFLKVTAQRLAINRARDQNTLKRRGVVVPLESIVDTRAGGPSPEEDFGEREEKAKIRSKLYNAIAALTPGERACLLLWLRGCSYKEIQDRLKITVDAVKSRLHDARARLRALLAAEPDGIRWPDNDDDQQE